MLALPVLIGGGWGVGGGSCTGSLVEIRKIRFELCDRKMVMIKFSVPDWQSHWEVFP